MLCRPATLQWDLRRTCQMQAVPAAGQRRAASTAQAASCQSGATRAQGRQGLGRWKRTKRAERNWGRLKLQEWWQRQRWPHHAATAALRSKQRQWKRGALRTRQQRRAASPSCFPPQSGRCPGGRRPTLAPACQCGWQASRAAGSRRGCCSLRCASTSASLCSRWGFGRDVGHAQPGCLLFQLDTAGRNKCRTNSQLPSRPFASRRVAQTDAEPV